MPLSNSLFGCSDLFQCISRSCLKISNFHCFLKSQKIYRKTGLCILRDMHLHSFYNLYSIISKYTHIILTTLWITLELCFFLNYLFIYGCVGSSFLYEGFLQLRRAGATLHRGAWASHYRGLSCCGAQAPDAQAQQLWLTGLVAPRHVGSSQTRAQTRVPCIGRQTLNHCAIREALELCFEYKLII